MTPKYPDIVLKT